MPRPTALVETLGATAAATALEERRVEKQDLHQMTMSPKSPPAAPRQTALLPCLARPTGTWGAQPA